MKEEQTPKQKQANDDKGVWGEPLTHIRDLARLGEAFDVVRATLRTVHLEDYLRACDMGLAIDICTMISARVQAFASSQTDRTGNEATSSSC